MLKAERLQVEAKGTVRYLPCLRQIKKLPVPAALAAAVIMTVRVLPSFMGFLSLPDDLRIRPDQ